MNKLFGKNGKLCNEYTLESIFVLILMLYPMRHIHWGLDLWDTGYNYANFQYMGLEHMDSMWLFSTYLANVVGHFLMKLPGAGNLGGMNLYTGLFVSGLALAGYLFCARKLGIPKWLAFLGEFTAISLCWCPTALLYNYLTYVFFLACVILLYQGLTREKMGYLFAAGVCLGANVLVRFSNLPEAAMIVAVWAYAFILSREEKKARLAADVGKVKEKEARGHMNAGRREPGAKSRNAWTIGFRHTLWCLGGYLAALAVLFCYIHIRYGMGNYIEGISRLFAMTDNATDYKAASMLMGVVGTYVENLYWVIRFLVIVGIGMAPCMVLDSVAEHSRFAARRPKLRKVLYWIRTLLCVVLAAAMLLWLYGKLNKVLHTQVQFCSFAFYSYDSMLRPGILFLMLIMLIALVRILHPSAPKEEKLISGMILLVVLLTSIGSNNGVYPSMNNLFVAAPYALWQCWRFIKNVGQWSVKKLVVSAFPAKCIVAALLAMCLFQFTLFGASFAFVEATGAQDVTAVVGNNEILKGIKMSPERARWMTEISTYVNENQLQGREVILYGSIPALSYYLQMPSAFNPWSDLRSYSAEQMALALEALDRELEQEKQENTAGEPEQDGQARPVIILEKSCAAYLEGGRTALEALQLADKKVQELEADVKLQMLAEFMEKHDYVRTFSNEKFVVWE